MPLVIHIRKGQQVIVNGAVIENMSPRNVTLALKNEAAILRDADILAPDDAATPAARVYYALQCAYLFPPRRDEHLERFRALIADYLHAAPSAGPIACDAFAAIKAGNFYSALKIIQSLLNHEGKVLSHVEN